MFCEDIYDFLFSGKVFQIDNSILDELANEMHVDLNMFGPLMIHRISGNVDGTLIITPKNSRMILRNVELGQ